MNDVTGAEALILGLRGRAVVGGRAYDSDALVARVRAQGMAVVIRSRATRSLPRVLDVEAYARRNVIERLFGRPKQFRRVATRYEKTAASYAGALALAALLVLLSGWAA